MNDFYKKENNLTLSFSQEKVISSLPPRSNAPISSVSIGIINFTNCLPINYTLEKWSLGKVILSRGNPTLINQLMKDGQIHVAPISSIEYLINEDDYVLLKDACITSDAECGSVILFSNYKIEELQGKIIGIPYNSATSIEMLKIILKEKGILLENITFLKHKYKDILVDALENDFDAVLYIGDNALTSRIKCKKEIIQYDLGKLWKDLTGLPPVFGVWVARADWVAIHKDDFDWVKFIINKAVEAGLGIYFNELIKVAASNLNLEDHYIKDYLTNKIKYTFTLDHEKSLYLFKELYKKLDCNPV